MESNDLDDDSACNKREGEIPVVEPDIDECEVLSNLNINLNNIVVGQKSILNGLSYDDLLNDYRNRMTPKELDIFDNELTINQRLLYLQNARFASNIVGDIGGLNESLHNNRLDALRHAIFHGLNTSKLDYSLSKRLGDAHEDWSGNDTNEKFMDLFNNEVGRQTYLEIQAEGLSAHFVEVGLINKLLEKCQNGQLKEIIYINNAKTVVNTRGCQN